MKSHLTFTLSRWHHRCNGHELWQPSGDGEGQGGLTCCSPWGRRVGHAWATEQQHKQVRIKQGDSIHRKRNETRIILH